MAISTVQVRIPLLITSPGPPSREATYPTCWLEGPGELDETSKQVASWAVVGIART